MEPGKPASGRATSAVSGPDQRRRKKERDAKAPRKPAPVPPAVRARVFAMLEAGASHVEIAKSTRVRPEQLSALVDAFRSEKARELEESTYAALVAEGVVLEPLRAKRPLPPRLRVAGGLSATVMSDRR